MRWIALLIGCAALLPAATIDLDDLPTTGMVVISGEADPALPWTYGTVVEVDVQPGDTLRIAPGTYHHLLFWRIEGSAAAPITIINGDGVVECRNDTTWSALTVMHNRHVRLTGTGSAAHSHGFLAGTGRPGMHTVQVVGHSSFIEVDHVEVDAAGFAGFNVKNEPDAAGSTPAAPT